MFYNALKTQLAEFLGISKDALHIHLGLAIFFALVVVLRRSPASILPWLGVLALQLANEALDLWHNGISAPELIGSLRDVVGTMLWPTAVLIAFRIAQWKRSKARHLVPAGQAGAEGGLVP